MKLFKIFSWLMALSLLAVVGMAVVAYGVYLHFCEGLPQITTLRDYRPPLITTVFADDGEKIAEFFKERRILVALKDMPDHLKKAFVSAEDSRFFTHPGVDIKSIIRAAIRNVEAGEVVQGGSTITQQVVKSFLLSPEKKFERKIREAILAYRLENSFSKEEILYLYLNQIYLGHGAYGVGAAAENYFGKAVKDLSLAECAMLAGLPQAPSQYSPFRHLDKARARQKYVLERMVIDGYITQKDADAAFSEALDIHPRPNFYIANAPHYAEYIRQYLAEKYGEETLYTGGLKVYTSVNIALQRMADRAVDKGLRELDQRHHGYRGPIRHLADNAERKRVLTELAEEREGTPLAAGEVVQGVVMAVDASSESVMVALGAGEGRIRFSDMAWASKRQDRKAASGKPADMLAPGDLIWVGAMEGPENGNWRLTLEQAPTTEGALVCIEPGSGQVKAMVGGRDFRASQFNRAIQAKRQPGSAFKPIVYTAALENGYTPATKILDTAFVYESANMTWMPKNYDRTFHGAVLLRTALAKSLNLPTINIVHDLGVHVVIDYAHRLGIPDKLEPNLSLALGTCGVSPLDLTAVYSVFANGGQRISPVFISRIEDRDGDILEESRQTAEQVIDPATAYLMTSLLESVVTSGTGQSVRKLGRPTAGKTGTTNDLRDAWFVGFTRDYITGVWVGYDQERPLGVKETGGRAASPIWLYFMEQAEAGLPIRDFEAPSGVVFAKIDGNSGLLPAPESRSVIFECFKEGTVPKRVTPSASSVTESEQLFKADM